MKRYLSIVVFILLFAKVYAAHIRPFTVNNVEFQMSAVMSGSFKMGTNKGYPNYPRHTVNITKPFWIGRTEVTQELWQAVMGNNPSEVKGAKLPVTNVSWTDCQVFVLKLCQLTGEHFRLPSEAEWEYAARGGDHQHGKKYSGNNSPDKVAWYRDNSGGRPHEVATKQPAEALGVYDMSGNVAEWCADWLGEYTAQTQTDPSGPHSHRFAIRGGNWDSPENGFPERFTVYGRLCGKPEEADAKTGFRLALDDEKPLVCTNQPYPLCEVRRGDEQDPAKVIACIIEAALSGNANAMYRLGLAFIVGINNITKDDAMASFILEKAAAGGDKDAMYQLAMEYYTDNEKESGNRWIKEAANAGHPKAMTLMWADVEKDPTKAREWLHKAAEAGEAEAMHALARDYLLGDEEPRDAHKAFDWAQKAANKNHGGGMYLTGLMLWYGEGCVQDMDKALKWMQRAADEKNNSFAKEFLGQCYYKGDHVTQDYAKAYNYFSEAANNAERPSGAAMHYLSLCYRFGHGTAKDLRQADYWEKKAQETGSNEADAMRNILTNNKNNMR